MSFLKDPMHPTNNTDERARQSRGNSGSAAPRSKGHDAVLNAIQSQERDVVVVLMSGDEITGKIVGRDKYTITVRDDKGRRQVIYKHGIERFWAEEQAATKGE